MVKLKNPGPPNGTYTRKQWHNHLIGYKYENNYASGQTEKSARPPIQPNNHLGTFRDVIDMSTNQHFQFVN